MTSFEFVHHVGVVQVLKSVLRDRMAVALIRTHWPTWSRVLCGSHHESVREVIHQISHGWKSNLFQKVVSESGSLLRIGGILPVCVEGEMRSISKWCLTSPGPCQVSPGLSLLACGEHLPMLSSICALSEGCQVPSLVVSAMGGNTHETSSE